jgi:UDP-N-acetylglucosamine/UDP-N-acetylgalactosamine diphosphorylase
LRNVDFEQINQLYTDVYLHRKNNPLGEQEIKLEPLKSVITRAEILKSEKELEGVGFKRISEGEVGVCIMSGGQGTRLGFDHPKGMFTLDLDSRYSLFEYFALKLLRLM